jgi:2-polyprenyl-3-methyl-5-hydroxy-6-metoxy-1,4-benzoquinol methylase
VSALGGRVRERFEVDDHIVSSYTDGDAESFGERLLAWSRRDGRSRPVEYLLPRVSRTIRRSPPGYMTEPVDALGRTRQQLEDQVAKLAPWLQYFALEHGVTTLPDELMTSVLRTRISFRRDLIVGTLHDLLGDELVDTTFLDIGCNNGYFSLDLADRGAARVVGIDRHPRNIDQARFLAGHYGLANAEFRLGDVDDLEPGQWDVVLNLGVLYHVTDPVVLLRQTYELTRRYAVVDTICHREPVSAFMVLGDKDTENQAEGRDSLEFLPTYRAVIDVLRHVGFAQIFEITGTARRPHTLYAEGRRRCFLAVKG